MQENVIIFMNTLNVIDLPTREDPGKNINVYLPIVCRKRRLNETVLQMSPGKKPRSRVTASVCLIHFNYMG
jgi:hypothetical protein